MTATPNLGLPLLAAAQSQKHVTHNEALVGLDTLVQLACLSKGLSAPPASPVEGDRYLVAAASPTGAWTGWAGRIARFQDGAWLSYVPKTGWLAFVADEGDLYAYTGSAWASFRSTLTALQNLTLLGIGTTADPTNPFSAKLNKALWTAKTVAEGGTGDLRYTLNKEAAANTLSLLLQSAFSGRAEIGLTGDDDLHLKVSSDGAAWTEAVRIDRATGGVGILAATTNLASAATTDIGSAASLKVDITGTTAITSFGTKANVIKLVRFAGSLTLTHNAASLILPGTANITTAAGDTAIATSDASGNFRVRHYQRADGTPVNPDAPAVAGTLASAATTDLGSVRTLKVDITGTTAITSFGAGANLLRFLRFAGALTLTHNATSLILPGAANIATAAGDTAIVLSDASGNWRVYGYARADGTPVSTKFTGPVEVSKNAFGNLPAAPSDTVLRVSGADGAQARMILDTFGGLGGNFIFRNAGGTALAPSALATSSRIGQFSAFGYGATGYSSGAQGQIAFTTTEAWTDAARGTRIEFINTPSGSLSIRTAMVIDQDGSTRPGADNTFSSGTAANRWSTVYAGTGTINTSDGREKAIRGGLSAEELAAWAEVRPQIFRFLDAVAAKGEERARLHAGYTAQAVREAFAARGLDPARYALWCSDATTRTVARSRTVERQRIETVEVDVPIVVVEDGTAVLRRETREERRPVTERLQVHDEAGEPIPDLFHDAPVLETVEETYEETEPTGEVRLGLRYDQCLVFEAAYLRDRLEALTARLGA